MVLRVCRSIGVVLVLLLGGLVSSVASPAWACGCGAYVPDHPGASVADERALIAWDGATENILMSLSVAGSSDKAAWVMPVPSAARITLGDPEVFEELGRLTAPRVEYRDSWWPTFPWLIWAGAAPDTAGAPGGAVDVLGRQRLGPFDVTRLAANDPTALATWLTDNGFPHPDGPGSEPRTVRRRRLGDRRDPARSGPGRSAADGRPAAAAAVVRVRQRRLPHAPVAIGDERRRTSTFTCWPSIEWIRQRYPSPMRNRLWSSPGPSGSADVSPALAEYVGDAAFLTRWKNTIFDPASIDGDYVFEQAPSDSTYQQVIYRTRDRGDLTGLILLGVLGVGSHRDACRAGASRVCENRCNGSSYTR